MSFETIRINELAKELGLSNKELLDKFAQISVTGKTHSSTVTVDQVNRLKEFIKNGSVQEVKKPKVFVVKKSKLTDKPEVIQTREKEEPKKIAPEKESKTVDVPKVEVIKPKNRLEIVRRAPQRPQGENSERRPYRPSNGGDGEHRPYRHQNSDGGRFSRPRTDNNSDRSEEHTSELQSPDHLVCRLLLEK